MPSRSGWPPRATLRRNRSIWPHGALSSSDARSTRFLIAIFFVKLFGFGPLAGVLTLAFGSTTFLAKTLAEDIENMKMGPIEALRATGASFGQIVSFGVMPQVLVKQIGIYIYRLDSNLRHSTIIGIVGAGGIGTTLSASFTKYDYDFASAILLCIAALVAMGEILSDWIRRRLR
ncbi:PhnE/PtxC family ABC transporter permease [Paracoccus sp. (in: a-proteobacteria)]|uniref:PhnE/PtxC family ABC transporter permease n=1 Tax=Paracoccus sp. TaxID=267 RepID=UPI002AFE71C1|nr:ABC transporter permease subunit [Paracoccus sp. (in: a-proteobacteria)]